MRLILSKAAIFAATVFLFDVQPISAQTARALGGPAEMPPANFQGQQYVDSRGCVFMRAGLSGKTTWVARIGRDRRPICNAVSMAEAKARLDAPELTSQAKPQVVAMQQPKAVGKPMATVASNMQAKTQIGLQAPIVVPGLAPAPLVAMPTKAAPTVTAPTVTAPTVSRKARCPAEAPVLERMALRTGGTVLVCTRGDGTATGWLSPGYPTGVGGTIENTLGHQVMPQRHVTPNLQQNTVAAQAGAQAQTVIAGVAIAAPKAAKTQYVAAWKDGRLNPLRGKGTAQGWAMQAQVWTQKTPADLVVAKPAKQTDAKLRVTQSTRSVDQTTQAPATKAARYVQVGTFGNPNNVATVAGALAAMGLPVAKSRMTKSGRELVIVLAGPFNSAQAAQTALGMAHQAGFGDAFVR